MALIPGLSIVDLGDIGKHGIVLLRDVSSWFKSYRNLRHEDFQGPPSVGYLAPEGFGRGPLRVHQ
jgi:hypothetical protein